MSYEKEHLNRTNIGIMGLGKTGGMYLETLRHVPHLGVTGMHHDQMVEMLTSIKPHYLLLAIPNPIDQSIDSIREYGQGGLGIVLMQNGVDASEVATAGLGSRQDIDIYRGVLTTVVDRDISGNLEYNRQKLGIGLAPIRGEKIRDIATLFERSGFKVKTYEDPIAMEWTKLFFNMINLRAIQDGLPPGKAFMDKEIFNQEMNAIIERLRLLHAAGIHLVKLPGAPGSVVDKAFDFSLTSRLISLFKKQVAGLLTHARGDALPAAYGAMKAGKPIETRYYLEPWIHLAEQNQLPAPSYETKLLSYVTEYEKRISPISS